MRSVWGFIKTTALIFGLLFVAAVVWNIFNPPEPGSNTVAKATIEPEIETDVTLTAYRQHSADDRRKLLRSLIGDDAEAAANLDKYVNCMGSMAYEKNGDLKVPEVFEWCQRDRENNPERFATYVNEIDAPDLASEASIVCQNFVEDELKSPSTADFPFGEARVWRMKRGRYVIKSYVDAQNSFGATVRADYHCEVTYRGTGNSLDPGSWDMTEMEIVQR